MGKLLNQLRAATPATSATQEAEAKAATVATVATPATQAPDKAEKSQVSRESQGVTLPANELRNRLLVLADAIGVPNILVNRLPTPELEAVAGDVAGADDPEPALRAYLLALEATDDRQAGQIPIDYTETAYCRGCGFVWLFVSGTVDGCPWCWNRVQGLPIPRPAVRCIDCEHFSRTEHPHLGHCAAGQPEAPAGLWSTDRRVCHQFKPRNHA